jgi:NADH pyrophosphatase NudC (nudix superfamily)
MLSEEEFRAKVAWTRIVAGCVIRDDEGKYLLTQEAQPRAYGLWNLPAGHVDKGETIEDAAVREAKEETGLDLEIVGKVGIWHPGVKESVKHAFLGKIVGGEVRPEQGELLDVKWFTYEQVVKMHQEDKLRAEWVFEAITIAENELSRDHNDSIR